MDQDNFGNLHHKHQSHLEDKQNINTHNNAISNSHHEVTFERIGYPWIDLVFPVTLLGITLIAIIIVAVILVVWLKNNNSEVDTKDSKMSKDLNTIEESRSYDELNSDNELAFTKDNVEDFNELEIVCDENHSPNIEKPSSSGRYTQQKKRSLKIETDIPKSVFASEQESKNQWILHPLPPLEIKTDVCIQPPLDVSSPNTFHSPLKCMTPSIFKFEVKPVSPQISMGQTLETPDLSKFSVQTPKSGNDEHSSSYYTPRTPYTESYSNYNTPAELKSEKESPLLKCITTLKDENYSSSPKVQEAIQFSPRFEDFGNKFTFSPRSCEYYTAKSSSKTPYEHFIFPDVKTPERKAVFDFSELNITIDDASRDVSENETKIEMQSPDVFPDVEGDTLKIEHSSILHRRSRLKSISLDSEGARIVEANLGVPVINLVESNENILLDEFYYSNENISMFSNNNDNTDTEVNKDSIPDNAIQIDKTNSNLSEPITQSTFTRRQKNINCLTINLDYKDETLQNILQPEEQIQPITPKTPTFTQTKQKAISLDSSDVFTPLVPLPKALGIVHNSSISVPSTPKRQQKKMTHKPHLVKGNYYNNLSHLTENFKSDIQNDSENVMQGEALSNSRNFSQKFTSHVDTYGRFFYNNFSRKMGSFDENMIDLQNKDANTQALLKCQKADTLGTNLQLFKTSLSVSNTNLKTLPEVMPLSDFKTPVDSKMTKKSILQRRGSNQSLTLNLESNFKTSNLSLQGSIGNLSNCRMLSSSNYSLQGGSSYNISDNKSKMGLLHRRGSNASLSLNAQKSNHSLNRFNSHSSLNINQDKNQKRGLLERRNSNTSLTLNLNNQNSLFVTNKVMSASNYNLQGSVCSLSSIQSGTAENKKFLLERRNSNASLSLNLTSSSKKLPQSFSNFDVQNISDYVDHDYDKHLEIPDNCRRSHRKSLSTESLFHNKSPNFNVLNNQGRYQFGSIDDLKFERFDNVPENSEYQRRFPTRNITTKPLSPQSTSEDFKIYLANIQILQNASNVLCRAQLKDLHRVFQYGYSRPASEAENQTTNSETSKVDVIFATPNLPNVEQQKTLLRNLHQEFWDLPTNFQEKPLVFGSQTKNRYKTILPNEHSRVILNPEASSTIDGYINANYIKGHDYTNNAYIVTQGPMSNTTFDFWTMVLQNCYYSNQHEDRTKYCEPTDAYDFHKASPCQKIVMLTDFVENTRHKCAIYFPVEVGQSMIVDLNNQIHFCNQSTTDTKLNELNQDDKYFTITNVGIKLKNGYSVRKLIVCYSNNSNCNSFSKNKCDIIDKESLELDCNIDVNDDISKNSRCSSCRNNSLKTNYSNVSDNIAHNHLTIFHYWFDSWPDHKSPNDVHVLLDMSLHILDQNCEEDFSNLEQVQSSPNSPILSFIPIPIIHCSAGIGRTGCLVSILNGIQQFRASNKVDILGIVCNMRLNRGGMVQNSEQYELIHKVLCLLEQQC